MAPQPSATTVQEDAHQIASALALLTPWETSLRKVRIGNPIADGGYVLADRFRKGQKVYSYGIGTELSFDLDLAKRGLEVFMYDHTIEGLVATHPNFHFVRQGVAPRDDPQHSLHTILHHIEANGHRENDVLLKMDVEGAEWDVLDAIDSMTLSRFEQIILEVHYLHRLKEAVFFQLFVRVFEKLGAGFHLIHVHANNASPIYVVAGFAIPSLLELTFLRIDIGEFSPWRTFIPSSLDVPNVERGPDHVLAFFPFLPTSLSPEQTRAGLLEASRLAMTPARKRGPLPGT